MKIAELTEAYYNDLKRSQPIDSEIVSPGPGYSLALNSPFTIYRGNYNRKAALHLLGNSMTVKRESKNTSNEYTALFSEILPSWKDWPRRDYSFVCGTLPKAQAYGLGGGVYRIYPKGDPVIAICPESDMWVSFMKFGGKFLPSCKETMRYFNETLQSLMFSAEVGYGRNTFAVALKKLDELWAKKDPKLINAIAETYFITSVGGKEALPVINDILSQYESLTAYLDHALNPVSNGFKKARLSQLTKPLSGKREMWFSGEAFFVAVNSYGAPELEPSYDRDAAQRDVELWKKRDVELSRLRQRDDDKQ